MELSYISGENLKDLKIKNFLKQFLRDLFKHKHKKSVSYKEAKFSKLKYFHMIIIRHFFSFYHVFFYTQQAFAFHILVDFCIVDNNIDTFFLFLL